MNNREERCRVERTGPAVAHLADRHRTTTVRYRPSSGTPGGQAQNYNGQIPAQQWHTWRTGTELQRSDTGPAVAHLADRHRTTTVGYRPSSGTPGGQAQNYNGQIPAQQWHTWRAGTELQRSDTGPAVAHLAGRHRTTTVRYRPSSGTPGGQAQNYNGRIPAQQWHTWRTGTELQRSDTGPAVAHLADRHRTTTVRYRPSSGTPGGQAQNYNGQIPAQQWHTWRTGTELQRSDTGPAVAHLAGRHRTTTVRYRPAQQWHTWRTGTELQRSDTGPAVTHLADRHRTTTVRYRPSSGTPGGQAQNYSGQIPAQQWYTWRAGTELQRSDTGPAVAHLAGRHRTTTLRYRPSSGTPGGQAQNYNGRIPSHHISTSA